MSLRAAALAALLGGVCSAPLQAYVLPSPTVFGSWVDKIKAPKTLHVRQRTTFFDTRLAEGSVTVEEEIWIRRPTEYRRTAVYPNGKLEVVAGKERAVRIFGGKVDILPLSEALGPLGGLYLYSDKGRLNAFLRQAGIDLNQTRWILRDRQVGWEVGDLHGPRLALSKPDALPMGADLGEKNYKFQMAPAAKFPIRYPAVIELYLAGKLSERTEVQSVETDIRMDDNLFEIPRASAAPGKK